MVFNVVGCIKVGSRVSRTDIWMVFNVVMVYKSGQQTKPDGYIDGF